MTDGYRAWTLDTLLVAYAELLRDHENLKLEHQNLLVVCGLRCEEQRLSSLAGSFTDGTLITNQAPLSNNVISQNLCTNSRSINELSVITSSNPTAPSQSCGLEDPSGTTHPPDSNHTTDNRKADKPTKSQKKKKSWQRTADRLLSRLPDENTLLAWTSIVQRSVEKEYQNINEGEAPTSYLIRVVETLAQHHQYKKTLPLAQLSLVGLCIVLVKRGTVSKDAAQQYLRKAIPNSETTDLFRVFRWLYRLAEVLEGYGFYRVLQLLAYAGYEIHQYMPFTKHGKQSLEYICSEMIPWAKRHQSSVVKDCFLEPLLVGKEDVGIEEARAAVLADDKLGDVVNSLRKACALEAAGASQDPVHDTTLGHMDLTHEVTDEELVRNQTSRKRPRRDEIMGDPGCDVGLQAEVSLPQHEIEHGQITVPPPSTGFHYTRATPQSLSQDVDYLSHFNLNDMSCDSRNSGTIDHQHFSTFDGCFQEEGENTNANLDFFNLSNCSEDSMWATSVATMPCQQLGYDFSHQQVNAHMPNNNSLQHRDNRTFTETDGVLIPSYDVLQTRDFSQLVGI